LLFICLSLLILFEQNCFCFIFFLKKVKERKKKSNLLSTDDFSKASLAVAAAIRYLHFLFEKIKKKNSEKKFFFSQINE